MLAEGFGLVTRHIFSWNVCVCVCVCVCETDWQTEVCVCERDRQTEVCVCVHLKEHESKDTGWQKSKVKNI